VILQRAESCAHALRLQFSRICLFPGKTISPDWGFLSYYKPHRESSEIQINSKFFRISFSSLLVKAGGYAFFIDPPRRGKVCVINTSEDYTESCSHVKGIRKIPTLKNLNAS
jgi:hypothetical protein